MRCMKKINDEKAVETLSVIKLISSEAFVEQEHPRDEDGKFTSGSISSNSKAETAQKWQNKDISQKQKDRIDNHFKRNEEAIEKSDYKDLLRKLSDNYPDIMEKISKRRSSTCTYDPETQSFDDDRAGTEMLCGPSSTTIFMENQMSTKSNIYSGYVKGGAYDNHRRKDEYENLGGEKYIGHMFIEMDDGTIVDGAYGQVYPKEVNINADMRLRIISPDDPDYGDYVKESRNYPFLNKDVKLTKENDFGKNLPKSIIMNPKMLGEAFVEQDHPRDEDGKFTDKSSIRTKFDQMFKDDTKEDFKIQEDHIEKVKEWYKEAIEQKVKWQNGAEYTIGKGKNKRKITEEDFDRIIEDKKQRIKNEEDELVEMHSMLDSYDDRPVIKITDSPNTQSVGIKGFKNGVGKFKGLSRGEYNGKDMIIGGILEDDIGGTYIDSSLNKNTSELAFKNLEYVKEAWNLLPDEDRNLIHFLKFRFSNSDKKNLGSFDAGFKQGNPAKWYMLNTIEVMLSNTVKSGTGAINTLMHEIGHVKWDQIQKLSPEKTKRFTQRMREIGNITPYQKTYENAVKTQESKNEEKRNSKAYKEGTDEYRKNMDKNMAEELENQYIIYGNEAHSEFYASLHAPTLNYGHRISQDNMEKVAEAYKDLHGIVD